MIDAVLTPHPNPLTCGTGKWSIRLAEQLGVPCLKMAAADQAQHPLVSARLTELTLSDVVPISMLGRPFDLIAHDYTDSLRGLVQGARRAYSANPTIADEIRPHRPDIQTLWAPSSLTGNPDRGQYRVLTYGMAHKLTAPHYWHLKNLLDKSGHDYTISVSTAVHEGSPWDESLQQASGLLREIFGDRLRVLGYLADDALAKELHDCDAVALFYEPALRGNNTTAWAALDAGKPLVTNTDEHSPKELLGRVINLQSHLNWPFRHVLQDAAVYGRQVAREQSWEKLIEVLRGA